METKDWHKVHTEANEDILGMVMDYTNGRLKAGELMDKIVQHCELSFKAGYKQRQLEENPLIQQGRQEVAEWVEAFLDSHFNMMLTSDISWQAKIKEWGLK